MGMVDNQLWNGLVSKILENQNVKYKFLFTCIFALTPLNCKNQGKDIILSDNSKQIGPTKHAMLKYFKNWLTVNLSPVSSNFMQFGFFDVCSVLFISKTLKIQITCINFSYFFVALINLWHKWPRSVGT